MYNPSQIEVNEALARIELAEIVKEAEQHAEKIAAVKPLRAVIQARCPACLRESASIAPSGDWLCTECGAIGDQGGCYNVSLCPCCGEHTLVDSRLGERCVSARCTDPAPRNRIINWVLAIVLGVFGLFGVCALMWQGRDFAGIAALTLLAALCGSLAKGAEK